MKKLIYILCLALLVACVHGSALSDLAASMKAGDWRMLVTNNILQVFTGTGGSCNFINPYSDALKWDPVGHRAYFLGSDHGGTPGQNYRFVCYDESTNTWIRLPDPPWHTDIPYNDAHGYDKTTIDPVARILYRNPYNSTTVRTYIITTGAWSTLPDGPGGAACCDAIDYFPDLGGLVRIAGSATAILYNKAAGQWSSLGSVSSLSSTWTFAEYNPVHKVMVLGSSTNAMFKVNTSGQLSALKTMAYPVYDGSAWTGVFTVDPVSGDYLVFTPTDRTMHVYDVTTDTWKQAATPPPAGALSGGALNAAPIEEYGVNLFVHCKSGCQTIVYKHADGTAAEAKVKAQAGEKGLLTISPNPFSRSALAVLPAWIDFAHASFKVYDINGCVVQDLTGKLGSRRVAIHGKDLLPGVYLVRLGTRNGNGQWAKKIVIQR
jgi:hypothetical protein